MLSIALFEEHIILPLVTYTAVSLHRARARRTWNEESSMSFLHWNLHTICTPELSLAGPTYGSRCLQFSSTLAFIARRVG